MKHLTEKEVYHFGIPVAGTAGRKQATEVQPFSFDERDRQLLKKKEETIQKARFLRFTNTLLFNSLCDISHLEESKQLTVERVK